MDWRKRITADPAFCGGEACFTGTPITVSEVLAKLASGVAPDELRKTYRSLTADDIQAAISYAADLSHSTHVYSRSNRELASDAPELERQWQMQTRGIEEHSSKDDNSFPWWGWLLFWLSWF